MLIKKKSILLFILITILIWPIGYMRIYKLNTSELGLKVLTWVKKVRGNAVDGSVLAQTNAPVVGHELWTSILQQHVDEQGNVNYQKLQDDKAQLDQYLSVLSNNPPGKNWTREDLLAYWINVYNAYTIQLILNHYPLNSIKDISDGLPMINSPWDIKFFKIGDIDFDLNTIEHEILRKQFDEPRIHFAINCASISCPRLRNEAYTSERLELQLEEQANEFIHDLSKNNITASRTGLSSIFNWFRSDFTKDGSLADFIQSYHTQLDSKNAIHYLEYNWGLNEAVE